MLAMDVSRSMLATDVDPDRITAARAAAESFVKQLPAGFRVGLVAFSTDARLVVAPTTDRAAISACHREPPGRRRDGPRRRHRGLAPGDGRRADDLGRHDDSRLVARSVSLYRSPTDPARPRSSPPSSCPTAPTRPARPSPSTRRPRRPRPTCRSTRSRSARRTARSTCRTRRPGRREPSTSRPTPRPSRPSPRDVRPLLRGAVVGRPRADLREPRLEGWLHPAGAGGHPVVRRGGPAARPRRRRPRGPLVQPHPVGSLFLERVGDRVAGPLLIRRAAPSPQRGAARPAGVPRGPSTAPRGARHRFRRIYHPGRYLPGPLSVDPPRTLAPHRHRR